MRKAFTNINICSIVKTYIYIAIKILLLSQKYTLINKKTGSSHVQLARVIRANTVYLYNKNTIIKQNRLAQLWAPYYFTTNQLYLGNSTFTRIQLKVPEKPRVQIRDFLYYGLKYCDWTHMVPYFSKGTE